MMGARRRCTARCHNAHSPQSTCQCVCEGKNHGARYRQKNLFGEGQSQSQSPVLWRPKRRTKYIPRTNMPRWSRWRQQVRYFLESFPQVTEEIAWGLLQANTLTELYTKRVWPEEVALQLYRMHKHQQTV